MSQQQEEEQEQDRGSLVYRLYLRKPVKNYQHDQHFNQHKKIKTLHSERFLETAKIQTMAFIGGADGRPQSAPGGGVSNF